MSDCAICPVCGAAKPRSTRPCRNCGTPHGAPDRSRVARLFKTSAILPNLDELADAQARLPERIFITRKDHDDLTRLVPETEASGTPARCLLRAKLQRAIVCPPDRLPRGIITLNASITYRREPHGELKTCVLVHPDLPSPPRGALVATAALGAILLGLPEGCVIRQLGPCGPVFFLKIDNVEQPQSLSLASP